MIRKIKTQEIVEKEKKRNQIIVGSLMVFLIVFSSLGYAIMSRDDSTTESNKANYGNVAFTFTNGYWQTQINNKLLFFNNLPGNLTNVGIVGNISLEDYIDKTVYIVNSNPSVASISTALEGIALIIQEACIEDTDCIEKNLPKKDCTSPLIIYQESANTSVRKIANCVYLSGDFFEATDKFVYRLFNIA